MLFNSLEFTLFFAAVLVLSLVLPHRAQNRMLLVAELPIFPGAEALYDPALRGEFLAFAAGLREDFDVHFVPRDALPDTRPSEFFDLTHLGPVAAERTTRRVAQLVSETLAR